MKPMTVRLRKHVGASIPMLQSRHQREDPVKEIGGIAISCDSPESSTMLEFPEYTGLAGKLRISSTSTLSRELLERRKE